MSAKEKITKIKKTSSVAAAVLTVMIALWLVCVPALLAAGLMAASDMLPEML